MEVQLPEDEERSDKAPYLRAQPVSLGSVVKYILEASGALAIRAHLEPAQDSRPEQDNEWVWQDAKARCRGGGHARGSEQLRDRRERAVPLAGRVAGARLLQICTDRHAWFSRAPLADRSAEPAEPKEVQTLLRCKGLQRFCMAQPLTCAMYALQLSPHAPKEHHLRREQPAHSTPAAESAPES